MKNTVVGGKVYSLNSKKLKLRYMQHLASALNLSTTATRSDLEVMIDSRLAETSHDTPTFQVVIAQIEEGQ